MNAVPARALFLAAQVERFAAELPPEFRDDVVAYLNEGKRPSKFLSAIIANDLFNADASEPVDAPADSMRRVLRFFKAYAPHDSFGSYGHLSAWLKLGGIHGKGESC